MADQPTLTRTFRLTAAQCNPQRELAPAHLVQYLIETATAHADSLGFGFSRLQELGIIWVLSRITLDVDRLPHVFETFSITTWVESYNRHFSERNFEITDAEGRTIGRAHTTWMAIDIATRRPADLSALNAIGSHVCARPCPVGKGTPLRRPAAPDHSTEYTFQVSDLDCNRHVTSARYVELALDCKTLDDYDRYRLTRLEIAYRQEACFGQTATIESATADGTTTVAITVNGQAACLVRFHLEPR